MRPIDLNNLIPNAQLASKVQQLENNKQKFFIQNQAILQNKKFEKELKKINTTDKVYHIKNNNKQKGNKNKNSKENGNTHSRDMSEKDTNKKDKVNLSGAIGTKIDIKI